ncbi:MAG: hypothetical protein WCR30_03695 [Clostridia bacterium]
MEENNEVKSEETIANPETKVIVETKKEETKAPKEKLDFSVCFTIKNLPMTLAIFSIVLTLIASIFSIVPLFSVTRIIISLSSLSILGSIIISCLGFVKEKQIRYSLTLAIQAFAIIIICL